MLIEKTFTFPFIWILHIYKMFAFPLNYTLLKFRCSLSWKIPLVEGSSLLQSLLCSKHELDFEKLSKNKNVFKTNGVE